MMSELTLVGVVTAVPSPTSFWLVSAPADSQGPDQLDDLNNQIAKHAQSTSLIQFPDFKVSQSSVTSTVQTGSSLGGGLAQSSSDPAELGQARARNPAGQ